MGKEIHLHIHLPGLDGLERKLDTVIQNQNQMAKKLTDVESQLTDLSAKADALQASLDAEQAQILAAVEGLNTTITENNALIQQLRDELAAAGADQETIDRIATLAEGVSTKMETIKSDLEGTIADQQPENPNPEV